MAKKDTAPVDDTVFNAPDDELNVVTPEDFDALRQRVQALEEHIGRIVNTTLDDLVARLDKLGKTKDVNADDGLETRVKRLELDHGIC